MFALELSMKGLAGITKIKAAIDRLKVRRNPEIVFPILKIEVTIGMGRGIVDSRF